MACVVQSTLKQIFVELLNYALEETRRPPPRWSGSRIAARSGSVWPVSGNGAPAEKGRENLRSEYPCPGVRPSGKRQGNGGTLGSSAFRVLRRSIRKGQLRRYSGNSAGE